MIYADFWDLDFPPFSDDGRAGTFILTHSASLVMVRLRYALGESRGVAAMFGEPGVGKTRIALTLLREFAAAGWATGYLPNPLGTPGDIVSALNPEAAGAGDPARPESLVADLARAGKPALLAVDDVQTARGTDFLETLRTLLNVDGGGSRPLALLLLGQAGMERRLAAASSFNTRLDARAVLTPMGDEESKRYILARLKAAGSRQGIFTRQAAELVVGIAKGNPRQINRLCEMSLVVAYGLESEKVGPEIVEMAAGDLDMLPAGDASFLAWPHPAAAEAKAAEGKVEANAGADILAELDAGKGGGRA